MSKKIKMVLYGEPGVGKSVFASKAPKPFFITTDGNYEWLEDFGAKEEDHIQVNSWSEAKQAFQQDFNNYETIVVDLTEDLFKWCEYEFCKKNRIEHLSDLGFAKGYDATRTEFTTEITKLLAKDKHVILIMHGITFVEKDRRGVEHTRHAPTNRLPDKVLDVIEGRVRYFLRCYLKSEDDGTGKLIKKRYLSLVPKENEFGIARGIDESKVPEDIALSFDLFMQYIGLQPVVSLTEEKTKRRRKVEQAPTLESAIEKEQPKQVEVKAEVVEPEIIEHEIIEPTQETQAEETIIEAEVITPVEKPKTQEEKLAEIKAKLAALKANKQ